MTQIWPVRGVAPVPILVSMICNPEGVVTGFPISWAVAGEETAAAKALVNAATNASANTVRRRGNIGMRSLLGGWSGARNKHVQARNARRAKSDICTRVRSGTALAAA